MATTAVVADDGHCAAARAELVRACRRERKRKRSAIASARLARAAGEKGGAAAAPASTALPDLSVSALWGTLADSGGGGGCGGGYVGGGGERGAGGGSAAMGGWGVLGGPPLRRQRCRSPAATVGPSAAWQSAAATLAGYPSLEGLLSGQQPSTASPAAGDGGVAASVAAATAAAALGGGGGNDHGGDRAARRVKNRASVEKCRQKQRAAVAAAEAEAAAFAAANGVLVAYLGEVTRLGAAVERLLGGGDGEASIWLH